MKYSKFTFCITVIALSIIVTPYLKVHAEQGSSSENEKSSLGTKSTTAHHITKKVTTKKKVSKKKITKKKVTTKINTSPTIATTTASTSTSALPTYSLAGVSIHNSKSSCWTIINGNVYDLTTWIAQHPGGEGAILSICGKDGSAAFDNQHGTTGRPEQILKTFQVGIAK